MQGLTQRQQMVLDFIRQSIHDRGYPPTLREIGARMGIRSTNGVNDHLRALERKGYLKREDMKSRALRPTDLGNLELPGLKQGDLSPANIDDLNLVEIKVLGRVAAGLPLLAEEHVIDTVKIDRKFFVIADGQEESLSFPGRDSEDRVVENGEQVDEFNLPIDKEVPVGTKIRVQYAISLNGAPLVSQSGIVEVK